MRTKEIRSVTFELSFTRYVEGKYRFNSMSPLKVHVSAPSKEEKKAAQTLALTLAASPQPVFRRVLALRLMVRRNRTGNFKYKSWEDYVSNPRRWEW